MFDEFDRLTDENEPYAEDPHWHIVQVALAAIALLAGFYVALKGLGRLVAVIGSVGLTLAAFAGYQWVKVWLNLRRQKRGPADDGSAISLNLRGSGPARPDADDQ